MSRKKYYLHYPSACRKITSRSYSLVLKKIHEFPMRSPGTNPVTNYQNDHGHVIYHSKKGPRSKVGVVISTNWNSEYYRVFPIVTKLAELKLYHQNHQKMNGQLWLQFCLLVLDVKRIERENITCSKNSDRYTQLFRPSGLRVYFHNYIFEHL